jgi:hypothetical protein
MEDKFRRTLVVTILFILFAGMIFHYSLTAPQNETVRKSLEKVSNPEENIGETVYFWSGVREISKNKLIYDGFEVVNVDKTVKSGDGVQIYGTIQSDKQIIAENTIVIKKENRTRLFIVSIFGVLFAISAFIRSWTVDISTLTFIPRESENNA